MDGIPVRTRSSRSGSSPPPRCRRSRRSSWRSRSPRARSGRRGWARRCWSRRPPRSPARSTHSTASAGQALPMRDSARGAGAAAAAGPRRRELSVSSPEDGLPMTLVLDRRHGRHVHWTRSGSPPATRVVDERSRRSPVAPARRVTRATGAARHRLRRLRRDPGQRLRAHPPVLGARARDALPPGAAARLRGDPAPRLVAPGPRARRGLDPGVGARRGHGGAARRDDHADRPPRVARTRSTGRST